MITQVSPVEVVSLKDDVVCLKEAPSFSFINRKQRVS